MTQSEAIIAYIRKHGSITQMEAASVIGCYRLGARIWELKRDGYPIHTENVTRRRIDGRRITFARYSLKEEDQR